MKPFDWNAALHPSVGWQSAYAAVAVQAKALLDTLDPCDEISTTYLVERLYPEALARGDGINARQRMFKALAAGKKHHTYDGYTSPGPTKRYMGKNINPPVWHSRRAVIIPEGHVKCPHCGEVFKP